MFNHAVNPQRVVSETCDVHLFLVLTYTCDNTVTFDWIMQRHEQIQDDNQISSWTMITTRVTCLNIQNLFSHLTRYLFLFLNSRANNNYFLQHCIASRSCEVAVYCLCRRKWIFVYYVNEFRARNNVSCVVCCTGHNEIIWSEFWDIHSGVGKDSFLLGYVAALLENQILQMNTILFFWKCRLSHDEALYSRRQDSSYNVKF